MITIKSGQLTQDGKTRFIYTITSGSYMAFDYLPEKKLTIPEYLKIVIHSENDAVFEIITTNVGGVTIDGIDAPLELLNEFLDA